MAADLTPEHWLPGEYAECIHQGPWFLRGIHPNGAGPAQGEVVRVRRVVLKSSAWSSRPAPMLAFDRWPRRLFPIGSFRKAERPTLRARIGERLRPRGPRLADAGAVSIGAAVCSAAAAVVSQVMEGVR